MSSLPFFSLPTLVQDEIVQKMMLADVLRFSLCSKRVETIVKWNKRRVSASWCFANNATSLLFYEGGQTPDWAVFCYNQVYTPGEPLNFKGVNMYSRPKEFFVPLLENNIENFLDHVFKCFVVSENILTVTQSHPTVLPFWKYINHSDHLLIGNPTNSVTLSAELADRFMNSTKSIRAAVNFTSEPGFEYSSILRHEVFLAVSPTGFSFEDLLISECKHIRLDAYNPTNVEFNTLIRDWLAGTKLNNLLSFYATSDEVNNCSIDEGIDHSDSMFFDKARPQFNFSEGYFNPGNARDIRRKKDGKIGTIFVHPHALALAVWDPEN